MPETDTCDWPRCRRGGTYTYSDARKVHLCGKHLTMLLDNKHYGYEQLHLKRKANAKRSTIL